VELLEGQLEQLRGSASLRGLQFTWSADIVRHLTSQWQPPYGVRHLVTILQNRVVEHLNLADAQGELQGVREIRLEAEVRGGAQPPLDLVGPSRRERRGDVLVITLA
jgi:ATP-dependent Clp protease ATP-binding subunit ClpA